MSFSSFSDKRLPKTITGFLAVNGSVLRFEKLCPSSLGNNMSRNEISVFDVSLPPALVSHKLLRYEAHLDRQLHRAMDQLERLQRQRKGENVPPPLNVNLGRRA